MKTKLKIAPENQAAEALIRPAKPDSSGIGVNYADEYLKAMNVPLENGVALKAKRKGLKVTLTLGDETSGLAWFVPPAWPPDLMPMHHLRIEDALTRAPTPFVR